MDPRSPPKRITDWIELWQWFQSSTPCMRLRDRGETETLENLVSDLGESLERRSVELPNAVATAALSHSDLSLAYNMQLRSAHFDGLVLPDYCTWVTVPDQTALITNNRDLAAHSPH